MTFSIQDPEAGSTQYPSLMGLIGTVKGYDNWSGPIDHVGFTSNSRYAHIVQNQGTGGALHVKASGGSSLLTAADSGVTIPTLSVTTLTATTANITTANVTTLNVSGNTTLGDAAGDTITLTGATTANGTFSTTSTTNLGDGNADAITLIGLTTFRNAANTATQLYVDSGNNRVIVGSATALGTDTTPNLQVRGRLYVAPDVASDQAIQIRRSAADTAGWWIGTTAASDSSLTFKDDAGTTVLTLGDSSTGTYQLDVASDARIQDDLTVVGDVSAGRGVFGSTSFSGSEELRVVGQSRFEGDMTATTGTFDFQNSGNSRLKIDSTGVGFFGSTPIAKPTVVGVRTGTLAQLQTVMGNLLSELANLGLITDSTT